MPSLASARSVKSPITPRLAAQHLNATPSSGTPPLARPFKAVNVHDVRSASPAREELTTPAKSFLNTNITPRSSSRKTRTDSTQSTPNGTPGSSRPSSTIDGSGAKRMPGLAPGFGLVAGESARKRPQSSYGPGQVAGVVSPSYRYPTTAFSPRRTVDDHGPAGTNFFHASDVRPQDTPTIAQSQPNSRKSPGFFYANGDVDSPVAPAVRPQAPQTSPSPPLSAAGSRSKPQAQFFRADGKIEDNGALRHTPSPTPRVDIPHSDTGLFIRPASPSKERSANGIHLSYRKGVSQILKPAGRPGSESGPEGRIGSDVEIAVSPTSSPAPQLPATSFQLPLLHSPRDSLTSPALLATTPGPSTAEHNELAANARRERKVLDLEISNSSLLAINRQLEREVKRQQSELRRLRRVSRAGISGVVNSEMGEGLPLVDEDETDLEDEHDAPEPKAGRASMARAVMESLSDSSDSSFSSDSASGPGTPSADTDPGADSDARHLARDSKRLQLDLTKHRELLLDSQRMNQALKRCSTRAEDMIREGRRALAYQVRVSDVKLGGRVLGGEEIEIDPAEVELGSEGVIDDVMEEAMERERGGSLLGAWREIGGHGMLGLGVAVPVGPLDEDGTAVKDGVRVTLKELDTASAEAPSPTSFTDNATSSG
ncbi:hypothetical protein EJ06DRAFT_519808 [Trichodelitschia bisporula]|uniref:Uncharacterized protein n=1 Tax=Trichodelitschia bisporula TaxID=703511 RepID=A0A6G1I3C5_9PEZI|nr:hypothetical protein EJ06DRAFT_519808 [Trichodelitschia bisporula]